MTDQDRLTVLFEHVGYKALSGPSATRTRRIDDAAVTESDDDVHTWFGLSYANYAVLPRTLLQSMPPHWQRHFVACMRELDDAFAHIERAPGYEVKPCNWQAPEDIDDETLRRLGFECQDNGTSTTYYDRDGNKVESWQQCVPVPVTEPVPHYNRGRARVEPYERVDVPARQVVDR